MHEATPKLQKLIEIGEQFTYRNFAGSWGDYGYPETTTPDWIAWTTRCKTIINKLFGHGSAPLEMLNEGLSLGVIGWGEDHFEQTRAFLIGALRAGVEILESDAFGELDESGNSSSITQSNRVFVVHGHDHNAKSELESILTEMGLDPIVLHRKPDEGQTVIEKFEKHSDVGFAFILLTPDDIAFPAGQADNSDSERSFEHRARPNVLFEFGYFVGKLGRSRVCCLYKGDVALPSDVSGLLYKEYSKKVEEVAYAISRELKAAGYELA